MTNLFDYGWLERIRQELKRYFASTAQGARADSALQAGDIGNSIQAYDQDLAAIASLSSTGVLQRTGDGTAAAIVLSGFINGLSLSNNTTDAVNDIDFGAGVATVGNFLAINSSTLVKRLDAAWAAGTNQGGLFSGSKAASTWYHCHVMRNNTSGAVDFGFDTSASGANAPAGWTVRRIGAVVTDSSGTIRPFFQSQNYFIWKSPVSDINTSGSSPTADAEYTLTIPPGVITSVEILASILGSGGNPNPALFVRSPRGTLSYDIARAISNTVANRQWIRVLADNAKVFMRASTSDASLNVITLGWVDPRGAN